jgi:hypothetical protein
MTDKLTTEEQALYDAAEQRIRRLVVGFNEAEMTSIAVREDDGTLRVLWEKPEPLASAA